MPDHPTGRRVLPASIQTILLTGFMGAGKTTVGRLLAERLGWVFLDLDAEIEREAGITIAEIFRIHGEPDFRAREVRTLRSLISRPQTVLALGGGAIETEGVRTLLASTPGVCTVYLAAPLDTLVERCLAQQQGQSTVRPVLADRERLYARWSDRLPHYRQAHISVETLGLTPAEVVSRIAESVAPLIPADPNRKP